MMVAAAAAAVDTAITRSLRLRLLIRAVTGALPAEAAAILMADKEV